MDSEAVEVTAEETATSEEALEEVAIGEEDLGKEVSIARHLRNGEEYGLPIRRLLQHGEQLFTAVWTDQEGRGRPLTKGTGAPLTDPSNPLVFPNNFNRLSAPDSNSCHGCHAKPFVGGGGDRVANAFLPFQRFDFLTFDPNDLVPLRGARDESGAFKTLQQIGNDRTTIGMFGSGFIEMLARQMTADLQALRDGLDPGASVALSSKGIQFGTLSRNADGSWDTSEIEGISPSSLGTTGSDDPPSLIVRPFHQNSAVVSLREFSNNAFNHHHGIQSEERFGLNEDPDGDGFVNEMTRADITAVSLFQATLPVPGRVIPRNRLVEDAVWLGEQKFSQVGCSHCHVPALPLNSRGWVFTEPNPFNPPTNLQPGDAPPLSVDLTSHRLPGPRLTASNGVVWVPAFTDLKRHDITSGPDDPNADPVDFAHVPGTPGFFAGGREFLTKKLWGAANEPPYFHHGKFTTLRQAILAHAGEAQVVTDAFKALSKHEQDSVIEFLKTLQVLPAGTTALVVDERGRARNWPPRRLAP
jgi:hypothetical protein